MKIAHIPILNSVFELVKTVELDIQLGEDQWTTRIEIYRDRGKVDHFRCRVWELEFYRMTPTFPRNEKNQPATVTDDIIMVDRSFSYKGTNFNNFIAPNVDKALDLILEGYLSMSYRKRERKKP